MYRLSFVLLICSFLSLSACATFDKSECPGVDWSVVGKVDGEQGRLSSYILNHENACRGSADVDRESYLRGREQGLTVFCTREIGFEQGRSGVSNKDVCPLELRSEFEGGYRLGRTARLAQKEREQLEEEIRKSREEFAEDKSVVADVLRVVYLITGSSSTSHLENRTEKLRQEVNEIESQAPRSAVSIERSMKVQEDMGHSFGALTGTVLGFGLGHAVQGRYASSGWMWTLGETAVVTAMMSTYNANCRSVRSSSATSLPGESRNECSNSLPALATLGWIGLRLVQSIDLWRFAHKRGLGYSSAIHESKEQSNRHRVGHEGSLNISFHGEQPLLQWTTTW